MTNTNQDLNQLIEILRNKRTTLAEKLADIDKQLEAATLTKALLGLGQDSEADEQETPIAVPMRELRGMTQLEAMVHVAKKNNGRIRTSRIARLLIKAGLMKHTKNSYNIAYTVIRRSGKFKPSGNPGEYELIEDEKSSMFRVAG
jgi:hypothetical protein